MQDVILDYHAQHWLRKKIKTLPTNQRVQLQNISGCNHSITRKGHPVFLLSNGTSAIFHGQNTCKQPFCCPVCSARVAHKKSKKIAAALDALKSDYYAFMVSFTNPHIALMSCTETTDILYNTWKTAFANRYAKRKGSDFKTYNSKGSSAYRYHSPINKFFNECEVAHYVRACEFTWGNNGWHPHFHCIFWVPRKYANAVYAYEKEIAEHWTKHAKKQTLAYWEKHNLHTKLDKDLLIKRLFKSDPLISAKFSRQECTSSNYISGWTSDKELTGNSHKSASHEGHLTPYQILQKAIAGDEKFGDLYIEFCLAVTRKPVHRRFEFSHKLHQIATQQLQSQSGKDLIKKKESTENWRVLTWFTNEEWLSLNRLNYQSPILANILWIAINAPSILNDFLSFYGISVSKIKHIYADSIEKSFNHAA